MLVQIDYELQFAAPFHFGTGIAANSIDRTVIRDAGHALYVPASTFKGVLREHCEQLCCFYLPNAQTASTVGHKSPASFREGSLAEGEGKSGGLSVHSSTSPHDAYATLAQFGKAPTLISRIFGSPLYPGSLRFNDARQEQETHNIYKEIQTSISTQVRIDRVTRTAAHEALYTSEFGTRYLIFEGTIKGPLNCTPIDKFAVTAQGKETYTLTPTYSLLILLAGLLMVERLGGNKSTGKGQCSCSITDVLLDRHRCTKEQWQSWIEQMDVLKDYLSDERGGQA